ncbi:uncharacterized protein TrAtP1_001880 [Trichoderma atroviride]|uniref:uncharacterized protein n=1 Tax=Hypocrea atroviridis TaxID=63577 RepID=UPI0033200189|nr:hypothetical protein TrAtP1_001880 [Trichoderma atroviride]
MTDLENQEADPYADFDLFIPLMADDGFRINQPVQGPRPRPSRPPSTALAAAAGDPAR